MALVYGKATLMIGLISYVLYGLWLVIKLIIH